MKTNSNFIVKFIALQIIPFCFLYSQDHEKPKKINFLNLSSSFNLNKLIMRIIINIDPKYKNDSQYYIDDQGFKTYILQYSKQISDNTIILFCQFLLVELLILE